MMSVDLRGIGIVEDKTSEKRAYEQINYISLHDPLTGLPNKEMPTRSIWAW